ncbi:MAG: hypothetical protein KBF64_04685 [Anaerolineaceae bacterium]|nr:hypothetical protein [Anaerolineaceae bacterium]
MKSLRIMLSILLACAFFAAGFLQPVQGSHLPPGPTYDDASMLQAVSEELLAGDAWLGMGSGGVFMAPVMVRSKQDEDLDMSLIEAELNAVKAERARLDAECQAARQRYPNDQCYLKKLNKLCDQKKAELKSQEDLLRSFWGDRRKATTKFFGRINAFRRNIWHKLGAPGRRIVRNVGEAVKEMVIANQPVTGSVVRAVLRREVRREIKNYAFERVVRVIGGSLDVGGACDEELTEWQKTRMPEIVRPEETKVSPTIAETETVLQQFGGDWAGGGACGEGEDPPFRWNVSLVQDDTGWVSGTISFHACPGGGAAFYNVTGQATEDEVLELTGIKTGGRGDLGDNARNRITFKIRYKKAPRPNLSK